MSDESEYYCGEDILEDEDQDDCDYGFGEFCVEPAKRSIGCCFECWLFQEVDEADRKEAERRNRKEKTLAGERRPETQASPKPLSGVGSERAEAEQRGVDGTPTSSPAPTNKMNKKHVAAVLSLRKRQLAGFTHFPCRFSPFSFHDLHPFGMGSRQPR